MTTCKGIILNPETIKELHNIAFRRIGTDVLKALKSIQRADFLEARSEIDIPSGLFGLSLENFYQRLKDNENTVYIDVLQKIDASELEEAKICIILDELYGLLQNLFLHYQDERRDEILENISNCQKLLTVHDTILNDYKQNCELYINLLMQLSAFNVRETNAILHVNGLVYGVQNECVEAELVLDPIEFRYKMSYYHRATEQTIEKAQLIETKLQNQVNEIEFGASQEAIASDSIQIKQRIDIENLKAKLEELQSKYDKEYDYLDGQIMYKTNTIESIQSQYEDSVQKSIFYASDIGRLMEWHDKREKKELEKKLSAYKQKPKKKKGGKKGGKK